MLFIKKNNWRAGFTLLEMLLVIATLSVVALAIYAMFNNGLKIWQKANRQLPAEELNIFFESFSGDIRNAFKFTGIDFSGNSEQLEFATLVDSTAFKKKTIGRVSYRYEPESGVLNRYKQDFADIYSGNNNSFVQKAINTKALRFQYYLYDEEKKANFWRDEYSNTSPPLAVRLELEFNNGPEFKNFTKTFIIPCSG